MVIDKLKSLGIETRDYKRKDVKKASRVATSAIGFLDSKNELDLMKGSRTERITAPDSKSSTRIKAKPKVAGKVGENLVIKPKDYLNDFKNDTKEKRIVFYESHGDLFGNTNGSYAQTHNKKLTTNKSNFEKDQKDNRVQHQMINDWIKMEKKLQKFATQRAIQPKINRYGRTSEF